jgi:anti-sigma-K factor RskA
MNMPDNDVHALSGAYALDALDDLERAAFERHLAGCADCRREVSSLREAASLLAETSAVEPPAELRQRVLAGIGTVRPLPPQAPAAAPQRPPRRHRRLNVLLAAAAAIVAVAAGAVVWQQPWETSQAPPSAEQAVLQAADARKSSLDLENGGSATVVHSDTLGKAVIVTHQMPPPPAGKVYQLWLAQPDDGMVPAGLMPPTPDQTLLLEGDAATATAAGITVEPEGGSQEPTTKPIALFDFGGSA